MEKTLFTKIIDRELPADILYEDDLTIAILDIRPVNPGHVLVITKKPFANLYELDDESRDAAFRTVQKVAIALKKALAADGINVHVNCEAAAGQEVFHFHAHVIPRFLDDGFQHWHGRAAYAENEREAILQKIRSVLTV